ncbi:MAG: NUDIX hydrolase [Planctomycetota bacterium]
MIQQALLNLLAEYQEHHADEAAVVRRIRSLVMAHEDCFERICRPGHITGSAWVISADGERHLLLHHRKLNKWLQPGGHADGDPDVARVALREATEESGLMALELFPSVPKVLDVDVHDIPARYHPDGTLKEDAHEHHDVRFLVRATTDEPLTRNEESNDLRWATEAEVRRLTSETSVLRLLDKAKLAMSRGV